MTSEYINIRIHYKINGGKIVKLFGILEMMPNLICDCCKGI